MHGGVSNSMHNYTTVHAAAFLFVYKPNFIHNYRLGEVCSHVAAVLFKVEACIRLGVSSLTCISLPCVWNQTF